MILVDDVRHYARPHLRQPLWAHLVSDSSLDELHGFAAALGLRRAWFQGDHYDVPPVVRERALALGARAVRSRELVSRMVGADGLPRLRRRRAA